MSERRVRAACILGGGVALLMAVASAIGLFVADFYPDPAWAGEQFRGSDLVSLFVAVPVLVVGLVFAGRGSMRGRITVLAMFLYVVYGYGYYVWGAAFNDLFLLHIALNVLSIAGLIVMLIGLDLSALDGRLSGRPLLVRAAAVWLLVPAAIIGIQWIFYSIRFAVNGSLPDDAMPASGLHLVYALDLSYLCPALILAAVLLWRMTPWGYVVGGAVSLMVAVYMLNLAAANIFALRAGLPGFQWSMAIVVLVLGFVSAVTTRVIFRCIAVDERGPTEDVVS